MSFRFLLFPFAVFLVGCHRAEPPKDQMPPPVKVIQPVRKDVPVEISAIGNAQAHATVAITAQVGGLLREILFKRGDEVKQGDVLFRIDAAPYDAALRQAQANLERDKVQLNNAQTEKDRYARLTKSGAASQEQFAQYDTAAKALEGSIKATEAAVQSAELQRSYCTITSPVNGVAGDLGFDVGNLIKANDTTPMVTLREIRPIYVTFSVPEKELPRIREAMKLGVLKVGITAQESGAKLGEGELTFIDNAVNQTTGTVAMKATLANRDEALWPGQFVFVTITLATEKSALVLPSTTVQSGQQGSYVYVVKPDGTAVAQPITVARTMGAESIISDGLKDDDKVISDGQLRVVPGKKVAVKP